MKSFFANSPSATSASLNMDAKNTVVASSSLYPGISTAISSHSFLAAGSGPLEPPSSPVDFSPPSETILRSSDTGSTSVFSISALTPTIASVPSAKQTRALPLVPGSMPVSAVRGRNWVGLRPSGRIGVGRESEVWRYASSAGERRRPCADGMIAEFVLGSTSEYSGDVSEGRFVLGRAHFENCAFEFGQHQAVAGS